MLEKIKRLIKNIKILFFKSYKLEYYKYVNTMLENSRVEDSDLTFYEHIDVIDNVTYPNKREILINKIQDNFMDKLGYLSVHTVCMLINFYCKANSIKIKDISSKDIYEYILARKKIDIDEERYVVTIKDVLRALKYFGFKESGNILNMFSNKDERIIHIGKYLSVENVGMANVPEELKKDKIIQLKIKDCICKGNPILIGLEITELFPKLTIGNIEKHKYKGTLGNGKSIGVYPFIITAYDDDNKYIKLYAGWGNKFGDNGYFKISYETFLKDVKELWYITNLNSITNKRRK